MRTKRITVNGSEYIVYEDGATVLAQDHYCRSDEEKPIEGVHDTEVLMEKDTSNVFIFDEETKQWNPFA